MQMLLPARELVGDGCQPVLLLFDCAGIQPLVIHPRLQIAAVSTSCARNTAHAQSIAVTAANPEPQPEPRTRTRTRTLTKARFGFLCGKYESDFYAYEVNPDPSPNTRTRTLLPLLTLAPTRTLTPHLTLLLLRALTLTLTRAR